MQAKYIRSEIMKDPEGIAANLNANLQLQDGDRPGLVTDGAESQDQEEGGVLLDQEDEAQKGGMAPLTAGVKLIDVDPSDQMPLPLTRANLEKWPRLPGLPASQLTDSMRSLSMKSGTASITETEDSNVDEMSEATSRRRGVKVYTESYPSLNSPAANTPTNRSCSPSSSDDGASDTTTTAPTHSHTAWTTPQTLFPPAAPTPLAGNWPALTLQKQTQHLTSQHTNLFHLRFWDPTHPDYDATRFYNPGLRIHECPFPDCGTPCETAEEMGEHFSSVHTRTQWRCPCCLKLFKGAAGLVAHCESEGGCGVKGCGGFMKVSTTSLLYLMPTARVKSYC